MSIYCIKLYSYKTSRGFDFVVKAEKVVIKEKGDNNYKVKLAGLSDFLKYQVWSNTNANNSNSCSGQANCIAYFGGIASNGNSFCTQVNNIGPTSSSDAFSLAVDNLRFG